MSKCLGKKTWKGARQTATTSNWYQGKQPRPNPKVVNAIDLLQVNLHSSLEPEIGIEESETAHMRQRMKAHTEDTNELFNLMARHIRKRG